MKKNLEVTWEEFVVELFKNFLNFLELFRLRQIVERISEIMF